MQTGEIITPSLDAKSRVNIIDKHHDQLCEVLNKHFGDRLIRGIEIGTNAGDSAFALMTKAHVGYLATIDPWLHHGKQFEAGQEQSYHDKQEEVARAKLKPYGGRVEILKLTSDEALSYLKPAGLYDFVWIDGHHTHEQVTKDIKNYLPLVREGGILGGHDYRLVGDVTRAIHELIHGSRLNLGGDHVWYTYI